MILIEGIIYIAFTIINLYIIYSDFKYKKIKNIHMLILFCIFLCYVIYTYTVLSFALLNLLFYFF